MSWARPDVPWHTARMPPAKIAAGTALLGGVLWIVYALLGGGSDLLPSLLQGCGLACVLVASAAFGATLVKSDAVGMRVVVGLASGLLALSLIEAFRLGGSAWYDGFWGIVAASVGALALVRGRRRPVDRSTSGGVHAR